MTSDSTTPERFYEVSFDPEAAVSLGRLEAGSTGVLREVILSLPVEPYTSDPNGFDAMEEACFVGPGELTVRYLIHILGGEVATLKRELARGIDFGIYLTNASFRSAAKHVLFRLTPDDGRGGSILYGIRVQRVDADEFVVWSDL
jgi:hypothetical protein